ncbi:MAG: hypothetical protein AAFV53_27145 [Myxococcota bacterium]
MSAEIKALSPGVVSHPDICHGMATIAGTGILAEVLADAWRLEMIEPDLGHGEAEGVADAVARRVAIQYSVTAHQVFQAVIYVLTLQSQRNEAEIEALYEGGDDER